MFNKLLSIAILAILVLAQGAVSVPQNLGPLCGKPYAPPAISAAAPAHQLLVHTQRLHAAWRDNTDKLSIRTTMLPELIDAIIEDVPDSSLAACSLTATAFVTSSQRRLFRWMSLSNVNIAAYERTAVLLASSRHRGAYVLSLDLNFEEILIEYPLLTSILAPLMQIERLSIAGDEHSVQICACSEAPHSLVTYALGAFDQVSLTHTHLSAAPGDDPISPPVSPLANLRHLRIVGDPYNTLLSFLLNPPRSPYLKKLPTACAGALTHLEMELDIDTVQDSTLFASIVSRTTASMSQLAVLTLAIIDRPHSTTDTSGSRLREVHFVLRYFVFQPERWDAFVPYVAGKLPRAERAGLLRFSRGVSVVMKHPIDG
ncbi:hypothetical protein C8R44DRAFT_856340 [Mycena epipterygia]|nr:hypothetical protein C8R44DRAFT_856340 [Mycena epipterygia]